MTNTTPKDILYPQQYDGRTLIRQAMNPNQWGTWMPELSRLVQMTHLPPKTENSSAGTTLLAIRNGLDDLFTRGPEVIFAPIYARWAREQGLIKKQRVFNQEAEVEIPIDQLDKEQRQKWDTFVMVGSVNRNLALSITSRLVAMIPNPDTRYIQDESLRYVQSELAKARKKLVRDIFPDLTDEEAKKLFGQQASSKEILSQ